jgi:hypothetical protein
MSAEHPERTPAAWTRECLALLQQINPGYQRNRQVAGRFIEFVRPTPCGLLVSQNFVRVQRDYYLSYALTFGSLPVTTRLYHPLLAGVRFHNSGISSQWRDDFGLSRGDPGYPSGLWSFGPWRSNTLENIARGFALNDEFMYPRYRQVLADGKAHLVRLFEAALRIVPQIDASVPIAGQAARFGVDPHALASYPLVSSALNAFTVARHGRCYVGFGPKTNTVDLADIAPELMVLHFADEFLQVRDRLADLVAMAEAL